MVRILCGQNYLGKKDNTDIDDIEFRTVMDEGGAKVEFYALTKKGSECSKLVLYIEGAIEEDGNVSFSEVEYGASDTPFSTDLDSLRRSILNAYENLVNVEEIASNGPSGRVLGNGGRSKQYVSDRENGNSKRYVDVNGNGNSHPKGNGEGPDRSKHVRSGFVRRFNSHKIAMAPCLIHKEDFSDEQLLDMGFDPVTGEPSIETVMAASEMDKIYKEQLIRKKGLKSIAAIRASYPARN